MINGPERTPESTSSGDAAEATPPKAPSGQRLTGDVLGPDRARPALPRLTNARAAVLRAVMSDGGAVTVATLAEQLGQHPNTVREHLDALVEDRRIERLRSQPTGRGRPAWLYRVNAETTAATERTAPVLAGPLGTDGQEYVALAVALIDQVSDSSPDPSALARQAGERWGRALADEQLTQDTADHPDTAPSDRVLQMLDDLRFEPHPATDHKRVRLTTCPFLDAAKRHPEVVCQIHLGIIRGAMERLGGNPNAVELAAFAEPGACLLSFPDAQ